jgi:hypothetical protein
MHFAAAANGLEVVHKWPNVNLSPGPLFSICSLLTHTRGRAFVLRLKADQSFLLCLFRVQGHLCVKKQLQYNMWQLKLHAYSCLFAPSKHR